MQIKLFFTILILVFCPPKISAQGISDRLNTESEREEFRAAQLWSAFTGFPLRQHLTNGSTFEVVGIRDNHPFIWTTHNQVAAALTQTNLLHAGYTGSMDFAGAGLTIGLWDAGPVYIDHQEFGNRVFQMDRGGAPSNHATHVAGTLAAFGIQPEARGMAYEARVNAYNWNLHGTEMQNEAKAGLLISNHSYGKIAGWHYLSLTPDSSHWYWFGDPRVSRFEDYTFGFYDRDAAIFDELTRLYPLFLPVVSAGNDRDDRGPNTGQYKAIDEEGIWQTFRVSDRMIPPDGFIEGYDTITSIGVAKNVLTIGALGKDPSLTSTLSSFSSMGPTDDGRIKPDLVGIGENLFSTVALSHSSYDSYSGTSMAAPNVAGSLLLLQELAISQWEQPLRAATLKALVLHTAQDLGPPGPDYQYGWGLLNTDAAAKHLINSFSQPELVLEDTLFSGNTFNKQLELEEAGPIKITLAWTDPPGNVKIARDVTLLNDRSPILTHNLDLEVYFLDQNETYYPYILYPDSPGLEASTGQNIVDPVEQIFIPDALPGKYHITISNKKWDFFDYQAFSLIVEGLGDSGIPVELKELTSKANYGNVVLKWETKSERVEGTFLIQKSLPLQTGLASPQDVNFLDVGIRVASGPETDSHQYIFEDRNYSSGLNRYRLLFENEKSGKRILLEEIEVVVPTPESSTVVSTYPNPFSNSFRLILDLTENQPTHFEIFNILGKKIFTSSEQSLTAGRQTLSVQSADWPSGLYFIKIHTTTGFLTRQIIKR